jgi:hypothetical protein
MLAALALAACISEPPPEETTGVGEGASSVVVVENPSVLVLTQRPIEEAIGEKDVAFPTLSPDGSTIAWIKSDSGLRSKEMTQLCFYSFDAAANNCVDKPEEYDSYPAQLVWSPDSAYITFSENPIQLGNESDIWVFDVASGEFNDLTDDGQYGIWSSLEAGAYTLDYLPMWNAADGLIYFWRSVPDGEGGATLDIYRVPPTGGEAELAVDLPDSVAIALPTWDFEYFYMDGPWAISPDGGKAAVIINTIIDPEDASPDSDGLWLIDLNDPEAEPQHVATMDDFQVTMPAWQETPGRAIALSWTADSQGFAILDQSNDIQLQINTFLYVDAANGSMAPITDFSDIPTREDYFVSEAPTLPPMFYSPWTATISPAGDKLLMWNDLTGVSGMLVSGLPPEGEEPEVVYASDYATSYIRSRVSTSEDGKVIMYGLLLTVEE